MRIGAVTGALQRQSLRLRPRQRTATVLSVQATVQDLLQPPRWLIVRAAFVRRRRHLREEGVPGGVWRISSSLGGRWKPPLRRPHRPLRRFHFHLTLQARERHCCVSGEARWKLEIFPLRATFRSLPGHVAVAPGPRQLAPLVIGASLPAAMSTAHYALHRSNTTWHGFGCDDMSEASLSASPWLATASLWDVDVMAGDGAYLATLRARSSRSARVSVNSRASVAQAGMCATHAEAEAAAPGASEMHVSATTAVLKRTCSSPTTCEWQLESGTAEKSEFAKTISAEVSTKAQRAEQRSATTSDEL